jgi:hypothetical protein
MEIEDNAIEGGSNGVLLRLHETVTQATFRNNTIENIEGEGLVVLQKAPLEISFNVFEKCGSTARGIAKGIPFPALHLHELSNSNCLVKENTFRNSRGAAILAHHGSPVLQDNRITEGKAVGILLDEEVKPIFMGTNTIERMGRGGVLVKSGAEVSVEHAIFTENGNAGILVEPGAKLTARDCSFTGQRGPGIELANGTTEKPARGLIEDCLFTKNTGAGVLIGKSASGEIRGGQFVDNSGPGIDIAPAGVTKNAKRKDGNGDIDYPEQLSFDDVTRMLRGKAEPGALVRLYRTEDNRRRGNPKNGEGAKFVGSTTATGAGDFAIAPGPAREGDLFTFTATRPGALPVTSEFSENIAVPPSPPFELISVSSNEEVGNNQSTVREPDSGGQLTFQSVGDTVSANGQFVVFSSRATNLVNDDTNNTHDVFVRDRATGATQRANVSSSGEQAFKTGTSLRSGSASISADGHSVVFCSNATNLVTDDGNNQTDVFLRDLQTNTTIAVTDPTQRTDGTRLDGGWDPSVSANGQFVVFVTIYRNFALDDTNDAADIYVWSRSNGAYERVSLAADGSQIPGGVQYNTGVPRISGDGRYVIFETAAKLVPADTNTFGDVYLRDRQTNATELISRDALGNAIGGGYHGITPDGRFVVFATTASLNPNDTNTDADVYVLDRSDGTMHFASPAPAGGYGGFHPGRIFPSISADARYVAFQGDGKQEPPDGLTSLETDIYVHDRQLGVTIKVSVGSDGVARSGALPAISADGSTVVFQTAANNYIPGDTNGGINDVYARTISPRDFGISGSAK